MLESGNTGVTRRTFIAELTGAVFSLIALRSADAMSSGRTTRSPHPDPRPGITAAHVLGNAQLPVDPQVRAAYSAARADPVLFDSVSCVCSCPESMHHRSLLACYETAHPTDCPGCLDEAVLVARLVAAGHGVGEVRAAIDKAFG